MIGTLHIVMAMKPLDGTFAENAVKHGVAGINIDGGRIRGPKGSGVWGTSNKTINKDRKFNASPEMGDYRSEQHTAGRWPANLILGHLEGCRKVGTKKVKSDGHHSYKLPQDGGLYRLGLNDLDDKGNPHADADGKETVEAWECQEGCPVKAMDEQGGITTNTRHMSYKRSGGKFIDGIPSQPEKDWFVSETGGASRFFKQVSELPDPEV